MINTKLFNNILFVELVEIATGKQVGAIHAKQRSDKNWKVYSAYCNAQLGKFLYYELMDIIYPVAIVRDRSDWNKFTVSKAARIYNAFDKLEYISKPKANHYQFSWHWGKHLTE